MNYGPAHRCGRASADTLVVQPTFDTFISNGTQASLAAGGSDRIIAGGNANGESKRALLRFDLSSIPAGATVNSATLTIRFLKTTFPVSRSLSLHRITSDWGDQGTGVGSRGNGAAAAPNDATWVHSFATNTPWATPGGDFVAAPSAVVTQTFAITSNPPTSWSSSGMVVDVAGWVSNPGTNFGWLVLSNLETLAGSTVAFHSRESSSSQDRPVLTVVYDVTTAPPSPGAVGSLLLHIRQSHLFFACSSHVSTHPGPYSSTHGRVLHQGQHFLLNHD